MKYTLGIIIPYYFNNEVCETLFKQLMNEINRQLLNEDRVKVVIVEDGQKSNWLDEYSSDKIELVRLKKNKGVSHARNTALDMLINECSYIAFIDSDDMIEGNYIDRLVRYASDGTHELIETYLAINNIVQNNIDIDKHRCGVWSCAIKSDIIGDKRFKEEMQINEDTDFMERVINLSKHRKILCNTTYYYNLGGNNDSLIMKFRRREIDIRK